MASAVDPTSGFITLPLNRSNLAIQKPFDVPEDQRYSYKDGVHKLWVFSTDKPHTPHSQTKPRTEIRIRVNFPYLVNALVHIIRAFTRIDYSVKNGDEILCLKYFVIHVM